MDNCWVDCLGNALEFVDGLMVSRQFLRIMRHVLVNKAEISDELVYKWYKCN